MIIFTPQTVQLGDLVRDWVTGYEGTATARVEYINGCIQYCIEPNDLQKGEPFPGFESAPYIDAARLQVVEAHHYERGDASASIEPAKSTGGFMKNKPRGIR